MTPYGNCPLRSPFSISGGSSGDVPPIEPLRLKPRLNVFGTETFTSCDVIRASINAGMACRSPASPSSTAARRMMTFERSRKALFENRFGGGTLFFGQRFERGCLAA